jgi:hypothetical protein
MIVFNIIVGMIWAIICMSWVMTTYHTIIVAKNIREHTDMLPHEKVIKQLYLGFCAATVPQLFFWFPLLPLWCPFLGGMIFMLTLTHPAYDLEHSTRRLSAIAGCVIGIMGLIVYILMR